MIIGVSTISWIGQLPLSSLKKYLEYVDYLVVSVDSAEEEGEYLDKVLYRHIPYPELKSLLNSWGCCKAYPRKVLWSNHFAVQEIPTGLTPELLEQRWLDDLRARGLVQ